LLGSTAQTKKKSAIKTGSKKRDTRKQSDSSSSSSSSIASSDDSLESEAGEKVKMDFDVEEKKGRKGRNRERRGDIKKNATAPLSSSVSKSDDSSQAEQKSEIKSGNAPKPVEERAMTAKKRKISQDGTAVITAIIDNFDQESANHNNVNGKKGRPSGVRFQRINPDLVSTSSMIDSRYEKKVRTSAKT